MTSIIREADLIDPVRDEAVGPAGPTTARMKLGKPGRWFRRRPRSRLYKRIDRAFWSVILGFALLSYAPELLAWPYKAERGATKIYSDRPIPKEIDEVLSRADALVATSPLHIEDVSRRLFLTNGGWRWTLLAVRTPQAFGFRNPPSNVLVFNNSDIAGDRIIIPRRIGGMRRLSGVIAHETTHLLVGRRYGELSAVMLPTWKQEGYADFVARESSLSPEQYRMIKAGGNGHPAIEYYEGRLRVAEYLTQHPGAVDRLLTDAKAGSLVR